MQKPLYANPILTYGRCLSHELIIFVGTKENNKKSFSKEKNITVQINAQIYSFHNMVGFIYNNVVHNMKLKRNYNCDNNNIKVVNNPH